jgi:urea transport system permease protein
VYEFADANFREKESIADRLIETGHSSARTVLTALLEDRLYLIEQNEQIVIVASGDESLEVYELIDPVSLEDTGAASPEQLRRILTNNRLRRFLRTSIARFALSSSDINTRLDAVKEMLRSLDATSIELLREHAGEETDARVSYEIDTALALAALDDEEPSVRLAAIDTLADRLSLDIRNRLALLLEQDENGNFFERDEKVRLAAEETVQGINEAHRLYAIVETMFFGISLGSVLALAAIGLTITFGVMGVINMAHGELMMLGAYTTYVVQLAMPEYIDVSILIAIPMAFIVAGATGVLIERTLIRFLYGRPLETLLATFGVSLVLQQLVRSVFSANNRPVVTPTWMSGTLQFNEAFSLTYNRLYIILLTLIVFGILLAVLKFTRVGLDIRAVSQNRMIARAMGIHSGWVDAMTFGLGSGIAGVAGVALSQLTNVGPNLGQSYIIDSFMVVVFGGVGNIWGTLIGGVSLGVINKVLEPFAGAVLGKILVLIGVILFIQRRPRGLFPQTGRAAESL